MSVCFMESSRNKRIIAMMVFYPEGLSKWQGEAAKMCRSVEANMEWLLGQMVDSFSQPYREILGSLESPVVTRQCGFMEIGDGPDNDAFGFMSMEDEFAELAGHISLGIISRRRRRLLYMTNMWPNRSVLLLGPADLADTVAAELEYDHKIFLRMESMSGPSPVLVAQLRRSAFQCVPTRQLVEGFKSSEWACSDAIKSLIRERWSGVHSSIIIEEFNNIQKNSGQAKGSSKFRRPERSFAAALSSTVIAGRNKYKPVKDFVPIRKGEGNSHQLNMFGKRREKTWLDEKNISSTQQTAPYWSPTSENCGLPASDALLWRDAHRVGRHSEVQFAYMGSFSDYRNCMIFQREQSEGHRGFTWQFPLTHMQDSAILSISVQLKEVPGSPQHTYVVFKPGEGPDAIGIFDWVGIRALRCRWRSPAWQKHHMPNASWSPAVRLIPFGDEEELLKIAAREAWWDMDIGTLKKVAARLGIVLPDVASLYEVLMCMVEKPLNITGVAASSIVAQRLKLTRAQPDDEVTDIIMNCDEAAQCLDQADERLIRKEQKDLRKKGMELNSFEAEFRQAARARTQGASSGSGSRKKRKVAKKDLKRLDKERLAMASQSEAKVLLPPGAFLWKARATSAWYARLPPLGSHSRTVAKADALFWVICRVWEDYCLLEGIDIGEAPIEGYEEISNNLDVEVT